MKAADIPADEHLRLSELASLGVLDTPPELLFDMVTRLAAMICDTPVSLISLVDAQRQWFKSTHGLPGVRETPRDMAFCAHAILDDRLLEVPCSLEDERFRDNPLVTGPPHIRFYAGFPLLTPRGHRVGTLCVLDRVARFLPAPHRQMLESLSRVVVGLLEMRRMVRAHGRVGVAVAQDLSGLCLFEPENRLVGYRSGFGVSPADTKAGHARLEEILGSTASECAQMIDFLAQRPGTTAACTGHPSMQAVPTLVEVTADMRPASLTAALELQLDRWSLRLEQRRLLRQVRMVRAVERAGAGVTSGSADVACRLAVSVGRFMAAVVARLGAPLAIVAAAGEQGDRLRQLQPQVLVAATGFVSASATGRAVVVGEHDSASPAPDPLLECLSGAEAALYLPIREHGRVSAVLALYAGEPGYFTEAMVRVLEELPRHLEAELERQGMAEERALAQRALADSEQRFRSLTRLATDWYWEQDEQFRFKQLGDDRSRIGVLPEYIGKTRWELERNRPLDGDWAAHRATLDAHRPFHDFLMSRHDEHGVIVGYISVSGEPVFDGHGQFCGYRGIGRDVSLEFGNQRTLRTLFQLGQSLRATHDPISVLTQVVVEAARLLPCERALIGAEISGTAVAFVCGAGGADCRPAGEEAWQGAGRSVLQRNAPLLTVEAGDAPPAADAGKSGMRAVLAVPLHSGKGESIGFVVLHDWRGRRYNREDQARLEALRNVGELALQNALAYHDMVRARGEVERDRARLAEAQQLAHLGSWELDLESDVLHWSDEVYRIFGHAPGAIQVTYEAFIEAVHPQDRPRIQAAQQAALAGDVPLDIEHRVVRPDGTIRHVHERGRLLGAAGVATRLSGTVLDVTERVLARVALEDGERRYRELFALNPSPTWVFRLSDLRFVAVNQAACAHYGYSEQELLSMTVLEVRPDDERERLLRAIAEESTREAVSSAGVWRHLRKDGTVRLAEGARRPLRYDGERCMIVVARDVTRQERVLAQLTRIGTALEEAFTEACIVDLDALDIIYINKSARENLGFTPAEMPTLKFLDILADGQTEADRLFAPLRAGDRGGVAEETRLRRKDGTSYPVEMRLRALTGGECVILASDISRRIEQQRALAAAGQQAQHLARRLLKAQEGERRHIARELHDQIGQTLTAAMFRLATAQRAARGAGVRAELAHCTEALALTQAQVRALSLDLRPPQLELLGLAAALRWQAEQTFSGSQTAVQCRCRVGSERFDPALEASCFRIAQEALNNVRKYAGAGAVEIDLSLADGQLCLEIVDDGAGFDVDAAERGVLDGRSLGLASMRERAALIGGRLDIRSAPGEGTRIYAEFALSHLADAHDNVSGGR